MTATGWRPADEAARQAVLRTLRILDTPPEAQFDDIAELATSSCAAPIGLVSFIDSDRQWFKARVGLRLPHTPHERAPCRHVLDAANYLEVPDLTADPRFAAHPLVTGDPHARFYAGAPVMIDGQPVGTVCVLDRRPRRLTGPQRRALCTLANCTSAELRLRRYGADLTAVADRLGELERTKDRILQAVGHEIRTPLAAIRGYLELLADTVPPAPGSMRFFAPIHRNIERLQDFADDILTVNQIGQDGLTFPMTDLDLAEIAVTAAADSRAVAQDKGLVLTVDAAAPVPMRGNGRALGQAIRHLLGNAIKFTESGEIRLALLPRPLPQLTITDTGVGIDGADLATLFEPLQRAGNVDRLAAQGTGLGLTIVKAIVDAHRGEIRVTSEPNRGTAVSITLPATG